MQPSVVIIANPAAGGGRANEIAIKAEKALRAGQVITTLHLPTSLDELHTVLAEVGGIVPPVVLACGGDGTVHQVLQETIPRNITLGIIPAGTGNDIARSLGLPTKLNDSFFNELVRLVHLNYAQSVDASLITRNEKTTWALGVISAGFDSAVNERANRMTVGRGTVRYVLALLAELIPFSLSNFTVLIDSVPHHGRALLIAIGNGGSYGGGMRICPHADMTDGYLDITWVEQAPRRTVLKLFPRIYSGRHVEHHLVHTYKAQEIAITSHESVIYADGERVGAPPVHIKVMPAAARILWEVAPIAEQGTHSGTQTGT